LSDQVRRRRRRRRRSTNLENCWNESLMADCFRNSYENLYWSLNLRQLNE